MISGHPQLLFGTIAGVCGDNLAICEIGGFKRGGKAHRPCRHCMATSEEISTKVCSYYLQKASSIQCTYMYMIL